MGSMKKGDAWFLIFSVALIVVSFYHNKHKLPHMIKSVKAWNTKAIYVRMVQPIKNTQIEQSEREKVTPPLVYLYGFGEYEEQDLLTIAEGVKEFFGYNVKIAAPISISEFGKYHYDTGYLDSKETLNSMIFGRHDFHMLVTNSPICESSSEPKLLSGFAFFHRGYSIVSTYQIKLNGHYYESRIQSVAIHELGHNLGLTHCDNNLCLMFKFNRGINTMCEQCKNKLPNLKTSI